MAAERLAAVYVTITTLDGELARKLEPRAAAPHRRLRTMRTLAEAGVPVGVSVAPQIPFVTEDMEQVLEAAWEAGARSAFYTVIRLPWEVAPLFKQWLELHYPQRAGRIMARIREMRGGKDYDADFATRMKGSGPVGRPDPPALREGDAAHRLQPRAHRARPQRVPATRRSGAGQPVLASVGGVARLDAAPVAAQRLHQEHRGQQPLAEQLRGLALGVEQRLLRGDHVEVGRGAALVAAGRHVQHAARAGDGRQRLRRRAVQRRRGR